MGKKNSEFFYVVCDSPQKMSRFSENMLLLFIAYSDILRNKLTHQCHQYSHYFQRCSVFNVEHMKRFALRKTITKLFTTFYLKLAGLPGFARDAYAPGIVAYFQRRYDFPHNSPLHRTKKWGWVGLGILQILAGQVGT